MRQATRPALLGFVLLCALPFAASASICEVETEQPLSGRGFYFSSDTQRWQEFVPTRALVCEVRLILRADRLAGDIVLRIEDEGGTPLSEITIEESQVTLGDAEYLFEYPTPVARDETHRMVLRSSQPDVFPAAYFWKGDEASTYEEGTSDVEEAGLPGFDYAFAVSTVTATGATPPRGARPYTLHEPAPNPFNPTTTVAFELRSDLRLRMTVHDAAGRHVRTLTDRWWSSGAHAVSWDGRDERRGSVASGVYVIRFEAGGFGESRRVVLLK